MISSRRSLYTGSRNRRPAKLDLAIAPQCPSRLKQGQYVVVIAPVRQQVQDQGRIPQPLQKRCPEHSAVETLAGPLAQDPKRCTIHGFGAVVKAIEKKLDLVWCVQPGNKPLFSLSQSPVKEVQRRPVYFRLSAMCGDFILQLICCQLKRLSKDPKNVNRKGPLLMYNIQSGAGGIDRKGEKIHGMD